MAAGGILSVGFYLIMYYFKMDNVGSTEVLWSFFPVSTGYYWYFTAYTGVFFLIPWLNDAIRIISRKELSVLTGILLGIFSVYATLVSPWNDPFHLETGYSFLWLLVLYVVGAWMKKCKIPSRVNGWMAAGIIAVGSLISWMFFLNAGEYQMMLVSYISPTIVASAASYMILFVKIKTGDTARKIISFAAPAAFGVYLIHVHSLVWDCFLNERFQWIAYADPWKIPALICGCSAGIFIVCICIEKIRIGLFKGGTYIVKQAKNYLKGKKN